jgi:O-antigen ligase
MVDFGVKFCTIKFRTKFVPSDSIARSAPGNHRPTAAATTARVTWVLFVSLLILFPWFYGGNRDWAFGALLVIFSFLLAALSLTNALQTRIALLWKRQKWLLIVLAAWTLLPLLQIIAKQTLDAGATLRSGLKTVLFVQAMLLLWTLLDRRQRLKQLLQSMFIAAFLHAVLACLALLMGKSFSSELVVFGAASSMGSFVNKNHFAGFLELHLAIGAGLLVAGLNFESGDDTSVKQRLRSFVQLLMSRKTQLRLGLIIMVVALVLTRSRMGNIAFFVSLLIAGAMAYVWMKRRPKALGILLVSIVVVDLVVVGSWFGARELAERIGNTRVVLGDAPLGSAASPAEVSATQGKDPLAPLTENTESNAALQIDRERPGVAYACWRMFKHAPVLGIGAGAFRTVFPTYRPAEVSDKFYDHAHNDWLQLVAEYGVSGAILVALLLIGAYRNLIIALRRRRSRMVLGSCFGALFGMTAVLVHGFADFNLQIPANALIFSVLFALSVTLRFEDALRSVSVKAQSKRA